MDRRTAPAIVESVPFRVPCEVARGGQELRLDRVPASGQMEAELLHQRHVRRIGGGPQIESVARHPQEELEISTRLPRPESPRRERRTLLDGEPLRPCR